MKSHFKIISFFMLATLLLPPAAYAIGWGSAPLACLPERVSRWNSDGERRPCQCPPQSSCPKPIQLKPEDVNIIISYYWFDNGLIWSSTYSGNILVANGYPKDQIALLLTKSADEIAVILDNYATGLLCSASYKKGCWSGRDITVQLSQNIVELNAWINDTLDIPVALASKCCDSVCPASTLPVFTDKAVTVVDVAALTALQAKVDLAQSKVDDLQTQVDDLQSDLDTAKETLKKAAEKAEKDKKDIDPALIEKVTELTKAVEDAMEELDDAKKTVDSAAAATKSPPTKQQVVHTLTCQSSDHHFFNYREGCILEGTKVVMADGSTRAVEHLQVGDSVKGHKGVNKITALNRFSQRKDTIYGFNGGKPFISPEHPILTTSGWKSVDPTVTSVKSNMGTIGALRVGDEIVTAKGTVKITSIDKHPMENGVTVVNMAVDGDSSFIAADTIVHGFSQVQIHY